MKSRKELLDEIKVLDEIITKLCTLHYHYPFPQEKDSLEKWLSEL